MQQKNQLNYNALGKQIAKFRKRAHMTQSCLAELADTSPSNISHIERGKTKSSMELIVRIANALGVSMDMLLLGSLENDGIAVDVQLRNMLAGCTPARRERVLQIMELICEIPR